MASPCVRISQTVLFICMIVFNTMVIFVSEQSCKEQLNTCFKNNEDSKVLFCPNTNTSVKSIKETSDLICCNIQGYCKQNNNNCSEKCSSPTIVYYVIYALFLIMFVFNRKNYYNNWITYTLVFFFVVIYTSSAFSNTSVAEACSKGVQRYYKYNEYIMLNKFSTYCNTSTFTIITMVFTICMFVIVMLLEAIEQQNVLKQESTLEFLEETLSDNYEPHNYERRPLLSKRLFKPVVPSAPPKSPNKKEISSVKNLNSKLVYDYELSPPLYPDLHK